MSRYEDLIATQERSCDALRTALETAIATIDALEFPLGSPADGYDVPHFVSILREMLPTQTASEMADAAADKVADDLPAIHGWYDINRDVAACELRWTGEAV